MAGAQALLKVKYENLGLLVKYRPCELYKSCSVGRLRQGTNICCLLNWSVDIVHGRQYMHTLHSGIYTHTHIYTYTHIYIYKHICTRSHLFTDPVMYRISILQMKKLRFKGNSNMPKVTQTIHGESGGSVLCQRHCQPQGILGDL